MKKSIFLGVLTLLSCTMVLSPPQVFAHRGGPHQHVVLQAFALLQREVPGFDATLLAAHAGDQGGGCGTLSIASGMITTAALREDCEDLIAHGLSSTESHFWDGDGADDACVAMFDGCYLNAYQKACTFLHPDSMLLATSALSSPTGVFPLELVRADDRVPVRFVNRQGGVDFRFTYSSLFELLRTGVVTCVTDDSATVASGVEAGTLVPVRQRTFELDAQARRALVFSVVGRICHLITDNSVPAHTHLDLHPLGDPFEAYVEQHFLDTWVTAPSGTAAWDAAYVECQGPFLDPYRAVRSGDPRRILRYLCYTTNQVANRFPSEEAFGNVVYDSVWQGDDYATLKFIAGTHHTLFAGHQNMPEIMEYTYRYAIRAVAGFLYWFACESGMLARVELATNRGEGTMTVNGVPAFHGYVRGVAPGSSVTLCAPSTILAGDSLLQFLGWQCWSEGGSITAVSRDTLWAVTAQGCCQVRACYGIAGTTEVTGPSSAAEGSSATFICTHTGGIAPYRYSWWTRPHGDGPWAKSEGASPTYDCLVSAAMDVRCAVTDAVGAITESAPITCTPTGGATGVPAGVPEAMRQSGIESAYPNPFNPTLTVTVALRTKAGIRLGLFDALGREVAVLKQGNEEAGRHQYRWEATGWATGVYYVRLEIAGDPGRQGRVVPVLLVR